MTTRKQKKYYKNVVSFILFGMLFITAGIAVYSISYWNLFPQKSYTADDFHIETVVSPIDYDGDGMDDFRDLMLGAREYVETKPEYKSAYYAGGYPPEGEGVCTDVIWYAFSQAGYSLKDLVAADIAENPEAYTTIITPDPNIDFRRVKNLKIFFDRNAISLTIDPKEIEEWQPGDIVVYEKHIAIVSDKRNTKGQPYIIHHGGQPKYEEDALTRNGILYHYRWQGISR